MNALRSTFTVLVLTASALASQAATWTPLSGAGSPKAVELRTASVFPIPQAIAARGGVLRFTLVGGGEGGHAPKSGCDDYALQGGKGGDGGEVIELDVTLQPGQCTAGIAAAIGAAGRGGLRGGNGAPSGEPGAPTSISCAGTVLATALGGGRRADAITAPRSAKGGTGGVIMNTLDQATGETIDQRSTAITAGTEGQSGFGGYGSGGGGGGATLGQNGAYVRPDGTVVRRAVVRNAPMGKAGYGAGTGAGPAEYAGGASLYPAENAAQYGAGGGGGAMSCNAPTAMREGGNGFQGLVKVQWVE